MCSASWIYNTVPRGAIGHRQSLTRCGPDGNTLAMRHSMRRHLAAVVCATATLLSTVPGDVIGDAAASIGSAESPGTAIRVARFGPPASTQSIPRGGALDGVRHRVLVSTDIGGTDPDDFQSMVHLLLYSDVFDLEGLISSPHGAGRASHIFEVIDRYERDYPVLTRHSAAYPSPDALRAMTRQGEIEVAPHEGIRGTTDGSSWIVSRARRNDSRPLHVLVWGGIEDLAQALHDAPDILPKLRVYFVGGPNKKWSPDAYHYIVTHHPTLWMIEDNATYRGWFVGGDQQGEWDNRAFVQTHVAGHGALGEYFATQLDGTIKMGDTPSVAWLLRGDPADPTQPGWGGSFVRAWARAHVVFDRLTTRTDQVEHFGIFELALPLGAGAPTEPTGQMRIENQSLAGHVGGDGRMHFRFSPKDPIAYRYQIRSTAPALDGLSGEITSVQPVQSQATRPSSRLPQWWVDDPSPAAAEGIHHGSRSVSRWRRDYLRDFALRMDRTLGAP